MLNLEKLETRACPALVVEATDFDPFPDYEGAYDYARSGPVEVFAAQVVPHLKIYVGGIETASLYCYDVDFRGGVNVATDGARVAVGTNFGAPHVREYDTTGNETASFYAGSPTFLGGVRVSYDATENAVFRPDLKKQLYLDGASAEVTRLVAQSLAEFNIGVTNVFPDQKITKDIAFIYCGGSTTADEKGNAVIGGYVQQSEFQIYPARVMVDDLPPLLQVRAILHEFGHLCRLPHSGDRGSVMFSLIVTGGYDYSELESRIIAQSLR
jgi:hypothetical protein